jgi:hypothetical protein
MPSIDFDTAVKQEEARLQKLHPTPDDISGCMSMFDKFLSCNGMPPKNNNISPAIHLTAIHLCSTRCSAEVPVQIRSYVRMQGKAGGLQVLHES